MRDLQSELDDVPGIGPRRRRTLLRQVFGSLAGVRPPREVAAVGENRGCRPCVFRKSAVTCLIDFAQVFIAFIVLLFSLTVHEMAHAWTA